ncbi:MAG: hypothetical protein QF412_11165, partial [Planctomycetota bacterium]|nr:hypothetical protein [Planctomycetota bacterium]
MSSFLMACPVAAQATPQLAADELFDPQHLVDVQIELPAADWSDLCRQTRNMISGLGATPMESPFSYFKGDVLIDG